MVGEVLGRTQKKCLFLANRFGCICRLVIVGAVLGMNPAYSLVNPVTGQLSLNFLDFESQDQLYSLRRNYHSARRVSGWFGLGMCTVFESKVVKVEEKPFFQFCGLGGKTPLDGSFGMTLAQTPLGYRVDGKSYSYVFDQRNLLIRIYKNQKLIFKISHLGNQKSVKGINFAFDLKMKDDLVAWARVSGKKFFYEYDKKSRLKRVSHKGKVIHRYTWKADKLVGFSSESGFRENYVFNKRGEIDAVIGTRCRETAIRSAQKKSKKLTVTRRCRGEESERYEFLASGEDSYFNYSVTATGLGLDQSYVMQSGLLTSMRQGQTRFSFGYSRTGKLSQLSVDDMIFKVENRDRFHAKEIGIYNAQIPDFRTTTLNLDWLSGRLTGYNVGGREYQFEDTRVGFKIRSPQYRLSVVQRGEKVFVAGIWRGNKFKAFRVDRGPASLSIPQQEVVKEVILQERIRTMLEAL